VNSTTADYRQPNELLDIAGVLRSQATRIVELEHELDRARTAADAARSLAYRESVERVALAEELHAVAEELHAVSEELHAVYHTKTFRYSARTRRIYQRLRFAVGKWRRVFSARARGA
jgi:hypothetical protein